jgi:hypothetical protein
VFGDVNPLAGHAFERRDESGQPLAPASFRVLQHPVVDFHSGVRLHPCTRHLASDQRRMDVVAPWAPGLFLVIADEEIEIRCGNVLRFRGQALEEPCDAA